MSSRPKELMELTTLGRSQGTLLRFGGPEARRLNSRWFSMRPSASALRLCLSAFTLIDLLLVLAVIAILASLLLPALSKGRAKAQGLDCLDHPRQMTLGSTMYSHDNADFVPLNVGHFAQAQADWETWAAQ